ncbi:MAG: glycosyltransferase family 4 protein [Gemmatimonadetes bacterium]|nr:glycosyltransferase family 4 protein [Gemmatimonadota bacterium]
MSRPLRILQMTHQGDFGGSTNSITYLTGGLADRGHEVYLAVREESLLWERFQNHARVKLIPFQFGRSPLDVRRSRAIRDIAEERSIDILNAHASVDRHLSIQARRIFRGRFRLVHTRRNVPLSSGGKLQGRYYAAGTDRIIAVSQAVADGMIAGGVPEDHVSVVHNGIPLERYEHVDAAKVGAIRERLELPEGTRVVGVVARKKSQEELMRAMVGIPDNVVLLFLGIDHDEELERLRKELALPHRVIYAGFQMDVLPWYELLTVYVLPSIIEGFSLSILEAMARSLPVVCTNAGGNPEAIEDGENGFLFEPGDVPRIHTALETLLGDEPLRLRFKKNNAEKVRARFSVENTIRNAEAVYRSLLPDA